MHHHGRVGGRGHAAGSEQHDGQCARVGDLAHQLVGGAELFGGDVELVRAQALQRRDPLRNGADVAGGLRDVAGAGLALGADHGRALAHPPQRLAEVGGPAHEGDGEAVLVDVVDVVGRREDLGLVDEIDLELLKHLGLDEVPDTGLGHDGDGDRVDNARNKIGITHAGNAALGSNVGGDALEGHDGNGSRVLGDTGLLGRDDVHDDAALEHVGQPALDERAPGGRRWRGSGAFGSVVSSVHGGDAAPRRGLL